MREIEMNGINNKYLTRRHIREIADYDMNNDYDYDKIVMDIKNNNIKNNSVIVSEFSNNQYIEELNNILNKINKKVIILFTDHDTRGSDMSNTLDNIKNIINNSNVIHIFSENWYDYSHSKITQIPLGISDKFLYNFGLDIYLNKIEMDMVDNKDKPLKVYCNAHKVTYIKPISGYRNDRQIMIDLLKDSPFIDFCSDKHDFSKKSIINTWKKHNNYAFELSPSGNGLDCHRTYEAIILNTIPIVRTNPLDNIYIKHNLPVVIVNEWSDVTPENLKIWHEKHKHNFTSKTKDKMKIDYWKNIINSYK